MNINCELQTNGGYICGTQNELPEYITLIDDGNGGTFYFSNILTPTDVLITFFFIFFLILFITKGLFNFVYRAVIFMKQNI